MTFDHLTDEQLTERARLNRLRGIAVSPELRREIERRQTSSQDRFHLEVSVSGGVTGHRVSLLKENGQVKVYDTRAEADAAELEYYKTMNGQHAVASFSARVVPARLLKCDGCDVGHLEIEQVIACQAARARAVWQANEDQAASEPKRDGRFLSRNAGPVKVPAMPKYLQVGASVQYVQGLDRTWSDAVVVERQSNGVVIRVDGRQVSIHASVIRQYLRRKVAR